MRASRLAAACALAACARPAPPPAPAAPARAQPTADAAPAGATANEPAAPTPELDWLVNACAPGANVFAIAMDNHHDVLATGSYTGAPWSDEFPLDSTQGTIDAMVVKHAPKDGSVLWRAGYGTDGLERAMAIAIDSDDDVYIAGDRSKLVGRQLEHGAFVAKLSGETGALEWDRPIDSNGQIGRYQLAVTGDRVLLIAGFSEPITAGERTAVPQYRNETFVVSMSRRDGEVKSLVPLGGQKNYVMSASSDGTTSSALAQFTGLLPGGNGSSVLNEDWIIATLDRDGNVVTAIELVEARGLFLRDLSRNGTTFATAGFGRVYGPMGFTHAGERFAGVLFWDENGNLSSTYRLSDTDGAVTVIAPWGNGWFLTGASEPRPSTRFDFSVVHPADGAVSTRDLYAEKWVSLPRLVTSPDRSAAGLTWWFEGVTGIEGSYLEIKDDRQTCAVAKFSTARN